MSSNHTNLQATHPNGQKLSLSQTTTDSPILPAANLLQLQQIDPKLVDWVVQQTEQEANFRRNETRRVNRFIFIERISGVILGGLVAISGLAVAAYVAMQGHDGTASIIGGATLVGMVTVLVNRKTTEDGDATTKSPKKKEKK